MIDRNRLLPPHPPNRIQKNVIDLRGLLIAHNAAKYTLFKLYTRSYPTVGKDLKFDTDYIRNSTTFNPNNPTRVIIHGWNNNYTSSINLLVTKAYLDRGDFNIVSTNFDGFSIIVKIICKIFYQIVIEWGKIAVNPNYCE